MSTFTYSLFCCFMLFGPKIGVVDLSILIPFLLLPFMLGSGLRMTKNFTWASLVLIALLSYQVIVQIVNQNVQFEPLGRLIRAFLTTVAIGLVISSGRGDVHIKLMRGLLFALAAHSVLIGIAALYYPVNLICSAISGNTRIQEYRASGLFAGFDIAGYSAVIGMAIIVLRVGMLQRYLTNFLLLLLFMSACYFTSRVSMAFGGLMFIWYALQFIRRPDLPIFYRAAALVLFVLLGAFVAYKAFLVLDVTFSIGVMDIDQEVKEDITSRHAAQDPDSFLWADMFYLPNSIAQTIFGAGSDAIESDVGYINEIFRYGFVGLLITIYFHLRFGLRNENLRKIGNWKRPIARLSLFLLISIFALTLKNNYILVRGIFPVFLIVAGLAALGPRVHTTKEQR